VKTHENLTIKENSTTILSSCYSLEHWFKISTFHNYVSNDTLLVKIVTTIKWANDTEDSTTNGPFVIILTFS